MADAAVKRLPASCMPSPESPANRMRTRSTLSCSRVGVSSTRGSLAPGGGRRGAGAAGAGAGGGAGGDPPPAAGGEAGAGMIDAQPGEEGPGGRARRQVDLLLGKTEPVGQPADQPDDDLHVREIGREHV